MANVFLLYRPFHFDYCMRIIEHQKLSNCLLINHYDSARIESSSVQVINFENGAFAKIRQTSNLRKTLETMVVTEETTVYIPHTLGLLANFAYYQLKQKYPQLKITVFYEGLIVFYKYEHPFSKHIKHYISRIVVGMLCGIRFTLNKKLLDLDDARISKIYSPFSATEGGREKIILVPLASINYTPMAGTCIIIGLRVESALELEGKRVIDHIFEFVLRKGFTRILFKDHPAEPNPQFNLAAKQKGIAIEEIKERIPIEKLVEDLKPAAIISIWSSALINLKGMLPEQVEISSFVSDQLLYIPEHRKIVEKFAEAGILVHKV